MAPLTARVRKLVASGATRSEVLHKLGAEASPDELEPLIARLLSERDRELEAEAERARRRQRGKVDLAVAALLLCVGFVAAGEARFMAGALAGGALLLVRGVRRLS
jgi:hypothetical protein